MKRLLIIASVFAVMLGLSACLTTGGTAAKTPAQIAQQVCGPTQSVLAVLKADTQIAASGQAVIAKVQPQVANICSAASTATSADLQTLTNFAFNVILPIAEATHPEVVPDLIAAQAVAGIVEANIPPASPAPARSQ